VPVTLNVTAAKPVLTVTASSATITYGDAAPSITPSYSGFVDGDTAAVLDTAPTCTAGPGPFTVTGSPYITTCSGGVDNNYSFASYVPGTLTVNSVTAATFADAPMSYWSWQYVESLYAFGITGGCGGGNYCPSTSVTRDQMAVFLVRTFQLPLP
jgi:hypothetical protein